MVLGNLGLLYDLYHLYDLFFLIIFVPLKDLFLGNFLNY